MEQFVATDFEGTLVSAVAERGLRAYLQTHSQQQQVRQFLLRRLPLLLRYRLKLLPDMQTFKNEWMRDLLKLFAGYSMEQFGQVAEWLFAVHQWPTVRPSVLAELEAQQANGRSVLIVSGMLEPMLQVVADKTGFGYLGTALLFENGRFTGQTAAPFNVGSRKVQRLQARLGGGQLVAAYGDTASDIPMLGMSQAAVAVHPDKKLRQQALTAGWRILEE